MTKKVFLIFLLLFFPSLCLAQPFSDFGPDRAYQIWTDNSNFDGILTTSDKTVQIALDTLDTYAASASTVETNYLRKNIADTMSASNAGGDILSITKTDANPTGGYVLSLKQTADGDAQGDFLACYDNVGADLKFSIDELGGIISNVTTGTAPFTIASTTLNTNLNADLLDGYSPTDAQFNANKLQGYAVESTAPASGSYLKWTGAKWDDDDIDLDEVDDGVTYARVLSSSLTFGEYIDATTAIKGIASFNSTNFTVTGGAVNTIQNIATTSTPQFARLGLGVAAHASNLLQLSADGTIGTTGGLTIDLANASSQYLTLTNSGVGDANLFLGDTGSTIKWQGGASAIGILRWTTTGNQTITFPDATGTIALTGANIWSGTQQFDGLVYAILIPTGIDVGGGSVYINPITATANYTLFGIALNDSERFRFDADGDFVNTGDITVGDDLFVSAKGMTVPLPASGVSEPVFIVTGYNSPSGINFNRTGASAGQIDFGWNGTVHSYFIELGTNAGDVRLGDVNDNLYLDVSAETLTLTDSMDIVVGSTAGAKIGTATTQKIGFWNTTPVDKPDALTAQLTSITHTAPGTPDYALQNLTLTGYGFVTQDEGNTVLSVIANLQARLAQIEAHLEETGLVTAN